MKAKELPSQEYLKECFNYNEETGGLFWKVRPLEHFISNRSFNCWNTKYSNSEVNSLDARGYLTVKIDYISYKVHRIIWKYVTGYTPVNMIDHIDNNPLNNNIDNLRDATRNENAYNSKRRSDNSSGIKGVYWYKKYNMWKAQIQVNKKRIHLGYFQNISDAEIAMCEAAVKYHGEFSNFG